MVSVVGVLLLVCSYVSDYTKIRADENRLSGVRLREMEYMAYIRSRNRNMYEQLLRDLREDEDTKDNVARLSKRSSKINL